MKTPKWLVTVPLTVIPLYLRHSAMSITGVYYTVIARHTIPRTNVVVLSPKRAYCVLASQSPLISSPVSTLKRRKFVNV